MYADTRDSDRPTLTERYATAIHSSNLASTPRSRMADSDVLAAVGIADRELTEGRTSKGDAVRPAPLAVALERLLTGGDNRAVHAVVRIMADAVWRKARADKAHKLTHRQATDLAQMVLAWHRHGVCKACGGHGCELIPGTRTLGNVACRQCRGHKKIPLEKTLKGLPVDLGRWLAAEVDRNLGRAGERAMAHLAASWLSGITC